MPRPPSAERPSPGDHGRSEVRERPVLVRALRREQRGLAEQMLRLRQDSGLTQEAAAEAMGLSTKQLRRIELGQANVTLATLVACAVAYHVHVTDLFERPAQRGQ